MSENFTKGEWKAVGKEVQVPEGGDCYLLLADCDGNDIPQAEANAERICLCVNSHDDLVKACEGLLKQTIFLDDYGYVGNQDKLTKSIENARKALSKARGEN